MSSRLRIAVALLALLPLFIIDWQANAILNGPFNLTWPQLSNSNFWPLEGQCELSTEGNGFADVRAILGAGALIQQQRLDRATTPNGLDTPSSWVITSASCITDASGNLVVTQPGFLQLRFVGSQTAIYKAKRIIIHPTVRALPQVQYIGVEGKLDLALIEIDLGTPLADGTPDPTKRPTFPPGYFIAGYILPGRRDAVAPLQPQGGLYWGAAPADGMNFYLSAFGERGSLNGVNNTFPPTNTIDVGANAPPPTCPPLNIIEGLTSTFVRWTYHNFSAQGCPSDNNFSRRDKGGLVTQRLGNFRQPRLAPVVGPLLSIASGGTLTNAAQSDQAFCTRLDIANLWIQTYLDPSQFPPPGVDPRPDLIIPSATAVTITPALSSSPLRVAAGQDLVVTVQFVNNATADSPLNRTDCKSSFLISVFLNETGAIGSSGGAAGSAQSVALLAGEAGLVSIGVKYPAAGNFTMAIVVDSDKAVPEANDLNNIIYIPITVVSRGTDLTIPSVVRTDVIPGIRHDFSLTVENLGLTASAQFDVGFYYNRPVAPTVGEVPDAIQTVTSLAALGTATVTFSLPTQDVARAGRSWFLADNVGVITEEIEGNNTASSVWGITNSPPTISSAITATQTLITAGDTITFTVGATDPERDPLTYLWDFGDGTFSLGGATISHTFASGGIFHVKVTLADGPFNSVEATFQVEVVTSIVNLGTINRGSRRLRFKLPIPAGFTKRKLRTTLVMGSPGPGVRYRNLQINGPVPSTPGEYTFGVEFLQQKTKTEPAKLQRFLYKYTVQ